MSLADEDDAALVARSRAGEPAAWEVLVLRYQRLVYAVVRRAGLDEHTAADVFASALLQISCKPNPIVSNSPSGTR